MPNTVTTNAAPAAKQIKKPNFFTKRREYSIWGLLALILGSVIMIFPFVFAFSGSLVSNGAAVYKLQFFKEWNWSNYARVFQEMDFIRYTMNTLIIAGIDIIGSIFSNTFVGFGFARYDFKGSQALFFGALCTMFLPGTVMSIPMFVIWSELGAVDTYIPLTIGSFFGSAMNIFLMRQCFKGLPAGLYEAALIDGAHPLYIYARIYMPLARPMIATLALRTFQGAWNNLFGPLIYITDQDKRTITLALANYNNKYETSGDTQLLMAAAIITMLPTVIIYIFTQKQFIAGMASAAIKG